MTRRYLHPHPTDPGARVELDEATSHHLLRVCRLPRGHGLVLFDGAGSEVKARLVDVRRGRAIVEVEAPVPVAPPHEQSVLLCALCKGPAFERILRMATELGATEIRPVLTARSVPRGDHPERWLRIVEAAAQQCGRPHLPRLEEVMPLSLALQGDLPPVRLVLAPGAPEGASPVGDRALLVGPEGGLAPEEVEAARDAGFTPVGLGPWTLRADTAVAAALARYGDPHPGC